MRILFCAVFILIYEDVTIIIFLTFWKATVNDIKYGGNFYEIDIMQRKNIFIVATEGHRPTRTCCEILQNSIVVDNTLNEQRK